jgi:hypothetical protein
MKIIFFLKRENENENYLIALHRNIVAPIHPCRHLLLEDVGFGK